MILRLSQPSARSVRVSSSLIVSCLMAVMVVVVVVVG